VSPEEIHEKLKQLPAFRILRGDKELCLAAVQIVAARDPILPTGKEGAKKLMKRNRLRVPRSNHELWKAFRQDYLGYRGDPETLATLLKRSLDSERKELAGLQAQYRPIEGRDHNARTRAEFYARCTDRLCELAEEYSNIEATALDLARDEDTAFFGASLIQRQRNPLRNRRYDLSSITPIPHRKSSRRYGIRELEALYRKDDKTGYFQAMDEVDPPWEALGRMQTLAESVDELADLKETVFLLRELCGQGCWRAVFAISLPLLEGLLGRVCRHLGKSASGSLTDKALHAWPAYRHADEMFDYFAWVLPNVRNSFCHSGRVPVPEEHAALDAVYDLDFLFEVVADAALPARSCRNKIETVRKGQLSLSLFSGLGEDLARAKKARYEDYADLLESAKSALRDMEESVSPLAKKALKVVANMIGPFCSAADAVISNVQNGASIRGTALDEEGRHGLLEFASSGPSPLAEIAALESLEQLGVQTEWKRLPEVTTALVKSLKGAKLLPQIPTQ
jgi:hypothetical protein